jgi:hypothetical protein
MPKKGSGSDKTFVQTTHTTLLQRRQFKAIRRLANPYPPTGAHGRLAKIADIATGDAKPEIVIQPLSVDLQERLEAGIASRSPRAGQKPPVKEQKRQAKKGRDRQERPSFNRTLDIND